MEENQCLPLSSCYAIPRISALPKHGPDGLLNRLSISYLLFPSLLCCQTPAPSQISPSICCHIFTTATSSKATTLPYLPPSFFPISPFKDEELLGK